MSEKCFLLLLLRAERRVLDLLDNTFQEKSKGTRNVRMLLHPYVCPSATHQGSAYTLLRPKGPPYYISEYNQLCTKLFVFREVLH